MDRESKYILRKIITDLICLIIVIVPILLFFCIGKPFERGFFCDDESIRHPFKDSTITSAMLYVIGMFVPITTFLVVEYIHYRSSNGQVARMFLGHTIHPWVWTCYKLIGVFGFGVACTVLTTDVAKYSIGRLRPHFISICDPNVNCTDPKLQHAYIEQFSCKGMDKHLLKEMRLSFPSGHSSFSAYTMIYLMIYLQVRLVWRGSKLLKHFLQFLCFLLAWTTALSRISDYKHHWSDVLAGSTEGTIIAILVAFFVSDLFHKEQGPMQLAVTESDQPTHSGNGGANRIC